MKFARATQEAAPKKFLPNHRVGKFVQNEM